MSISNARALLLACANPYVGDDGWIRQTAADSLDWVDLLKGAAWHGVTPLVAKNLRGIAGVPDWVRRDLRCFEQVLGFRSQHQASRLRVCLDLLHDAGTDAIPWKGPALAYDAYGDVRSRSSCDIDLLVKPGELRLCRDVLLQAGFTYERENQALTGRRRSRVEEISGEVRLRGPDNSFLIELHQQFLPASLEKRHILREMWDRSLRSEGWDGKDVRKLQPEDLILTLCVHATKHGWDRLKWVADIAATLHTWAAALDWERLLRFADKHNLRAMPLLGVALACRNLHAPAPEAVVAEIANHPLLIKIVQDQDLVYATDSLPTTPIAHSLSMRLATSSRRQRIAGAAREALTTRPSDIAEFPGNDRLLWLVPVYRLGSLAIRHGLRRTSGWRQTRVETVFAKWAKLSGEEQHFIIRAMLILWLVRVGLWVFPFRRVLAVTENHLPPSLSWRTTPAGSADHCARWIPSAARLIPKASCLTQAIAARWLLQSAGLQCELQLGVGRRLGKFSAHAVLIHERRIVVGGRPLADQNFERIYSC